MRGERSMGFAERVQCLFQHAHRIGPAEQRCVSLSELRSKLCPKAAFGDRYGLFESLACDRPPGLQLRTRHRAKHFDSDFGGRWLGK
jgi:hypothetical protein